MGIADAILDLVSSGTTLKENNLKEIEGGVVLQSQVWCERYMELVIILHLSSCFTRTFFSFVLSGCTRGKQEGIDWENRSIRHSAWDSREIGSPLEGGWSIHCMRIVIVMFSHDLYFCTLSSYVFTSGCCKHERNGCWGSGCTFENPTITLRIAGKENICTSV